MIRASCIGTAIAATAILLAAPSGADPLADLMGMLPAGYNQGSCQPVERSTALVAVTCRDNILPGGPVYATYSLFADRKATNAAFTAYLNSPARSAAICPGMQSSGPVPLIGPDGSEGGSIACGRASTFDVERDGSVAWTKDTDRFLGVAYAGYQGQAYPKDLFTWAVTQHIQGDCNAANGTYSTWMGDAGISYASCCYQAPDGKKYCGDYADGIYQETSLQDGPAQPTGPSSVPTQGPGVSPRPMPTPMGPPRG